MQQDGETEDYSALYVRIPTRIKQDLEDLARARDRERPNGERVTAAAITTLALKRYLDDAKRKR